MSNLSEWAARFSDDVILRRLEHDSDVTGLYETQRRRGSTFIKGKIRKETL